MKKAIQLMIILAVMAMPVMASAQSMNFGVKLSGHDLQSAQIGMLMGSLQPYFGLDYYSVGGDFGEGDAKMEASAALFIPQVGLRLFLSQNNPTKPYIFGSFFKSFPSVSAEAGGEKAPDEVLDPIKEALGFWGLAFGFGAEYAVNEWFAVGGEFGLKWYNIGLNDVVIPLGLYDPTLPEITGDFSAALRYTYAAFVLNFFL